MRQILIFFVFAVACLSMPICAQTVDLEDDISSADDVGLWLEASATKRINKHWSVEGGTEFRMNDNISTPNRFSLGGSVSYRPLKWMRLSAGYIWLYGHKAAKDKINYTSDEQPQKKNYKYTPAYWSSRHRVNAELAMQAPKLWRCVQLSARLRYQFTWRNAFTVDRLKYKYIDTLDEEGNTIRVLSDDDPQSDPDEKEYASTHYLRSRIKAEYEKKRCPWSPYISYEFFNDLSTSMTMVKSRLGVGTGYKINKKNSVSLGYLFAVEYADGANQRSHIITAGYEFKF